MDGPQQARERWERDKRAKGGLLAGTGRSVTTRALIRERLYARPPEGEEEAAAALGGRAKPAAEAYPSLERAWRRGVYNDALDTPARTLPPLLATACCRWLCWWCWW